MTASSFTALFLGDLVGSPGFRAVLSLLPEIRAQYQPDLVVVNAENAAPDGLGLVPEQVDQLLAAGVDVITTGNHVWEKKELWPLLDTQPRLLRPDNYPEGLAGSGFCRLEIADQPVVVINLQGRQRLALIDDPFRRGRELALRARQSTPLVFVDFHAEAADEKEAFGFWLDGLVSAVVGTHTHVATADQRILPQGTAYISDLGMCGPVASVIGSDPALSIERSLTMLPLRSQILEGPAVLQGLLVEVDRQTGRAMRLERLER